MEIKMIRDTNGLFDSSCSSQIVGSIDRTVPWFLLGAYSYEILSESVISDSLFDRISLLIPQHWDTIQHRHKNYCYPSNEEPGGAISTAMGLTYPSIVPNAVSSLLRLP